MSLQLERSKQLEYNLAVLKRRDAAITRILDMAGHVVLYQFNEDSKGWEAVGRLDLAGRGFCTGALISPDLVLTAAHCLLQHAMQDVCVVCVARGRIRPPATYMKMDTSTNRMIVKKYMSVWPAHHKHITSSTSQTNK